MGSGFYIHCPCLVNASDNCFVFSWSSTRLKDSLGRNWVDIISLGHSMLFCEILCIDHPAPIVVCDCIAYLRNRGLAEKGIFDTSGNIAVVGGLKRRYNQEFATMEHKLSNTASVLNQWFPAPALTDVAALLKIFFNELKEPVRRNCCSILSTWM